MSVGVLVCRVFLASVRGVFVFGMLVRMGVNGPVAMVMFVLVLHVFVGVGMRDSPRVQVLVGVRLGCHAICIQ
jgi:hypothetical protein